MIRKNCTLSDCIFYSMAIVWYFDRWGHVRNIHKLKLVNDENKYIEHSCSFDVQVKEVS